MKVLRTEDPGEFGYEFKIHLFRSTPEAPEFTQEFEMLVMQVLSDYDASNIRSNGVEDKLRVNFRIKNKDLAVKFYIDINKHAYMFDN